MRVMVAREALEAERNAAELRALGIDAHAVAGLHIEPTLSAEAAKPLAEGLNAVHAVMAVSANAVNAFWNPVLKGFCPSVAGFIASFATTSIAMQFPSLQHWVTGPHSAAALKALGAAPNSITQPAADGPQDSEHLWQALQSQRGVWNALAPPPTVWLIRGQDPDSSTGRPWLADQLRAAGVQVQEHTVYRRVLPSYTPEQLQTYAASMQQGDTWIFANGLVLHHLCAQLVRQSPLGSHLLRAAKVRVTHASIGHAAMALGFEQVQTLAPNTPVSRWGDVEPT